MLIDNAKVYLKNNKKEIGKGIAFLILICVYAASLLPHTIALLYGLLFSTVFLVLLYYRKVGHPLVKALAFVFFYIWIGFDDKCYIFEDISNYSRYFYCILTIFVAIYLYYRWGRRESDDKDKRVGFWHVFVVEFLFWGYAILYKVEAGTVPIIETVVLIAAMYVWSACMTGAGVHLLAMIANKMQITLTTEQNYRRIWITVFVILVTGGGLFSILFYPGVISTDTIAIYEAAMNLGDKTVRTDIHSFAYTCFERLVFSICDNFYFLTWILIMAFSAAWASFMTNICRLGLNHRIAYYVTFVWLLVPSNLYMLICTWKDMPFTICFIVAAGRLMRISAHEKGVQLGWRDYVLLAIGVIGAALFRSNGQFVLLAVIIAGIFHAIRFKERTSLFMLASLVISGIVVLIVKIPVYRGFQVEGTPDGFIAIPFVDGVWENVAYGDGIPDEVVSYVEDNIMPIGEFRELYKEDYTNTYSFSPHVVLEFDDAKDAWYSCLKTNPFVTIMARLKKTYNLWSVFPRGKIPVATNYVRKIIDGANLNYLPIPLFEKLRNVFGLCYSSEWLYGTFCFIIARGGWNVFLWIVLELFLKRKGLKNCRIVIVPAAANTVALLIACCYQDYRYMYPTFVLTILYMLYVLQVYAMCGEKNP